MPVSCRRAHSGASACAASARRAAPTSAAASAPLKLKPLALPSASVSGVASTTVSARPPTFAHHRHRAVAQAVHLVEPARLEARGHQEDVGTRLDAVRQRLVVADAQRRSARDVRRRAPRAPPRRPDRRCRASRPAPGAPSSTGSASSSRSMPFCSTRRPMNAEQRCGGIRVEAHFGLQRDLVLALARQRGRAVVQRQRGDRARDSTPWYRCRSGCRSAPARGDAAARRDRGRIPRSGSRAHSWGSPWSRGRRTRCRP